MIPTFTYLGSTVSNSVNLDSELNGRIGKAAGTMVKLNRAPPPNSRAWKNSKFTEIIKLRVYQACVLSPLLYSSETWTTNRRQEKRLNSFHLRCLRRILHIHWQDRITNSESVERASITSIFAVLSKRRITWLGHLRRMDPGRIPKDLLFGELAEGSRPVGRPRPRYEDTCKHDMKLSDMDVDKRESYADDRAKWRTTVGDVTSAEERRRAEQENKRRNGNRGEHRPRRRQLTTVGAVTGDCHSRIGLRRNSRKYQKN